MFLTPFALMFLVYMVYRLGYNTAKGEFEERYKDAMESQERMDEYLRSKARRQL